VVAITIETANGGSSSRRYALHDDDDATDDALHSGSSIWHAPADLARDPGSMSLGTSLLQGHTVVAIANNFAPYVSFSVLVCPSVLTMSFPAPCADSVHPPGMLTCHAVLLSLLKKSGKVFVTLFPRFPLPWPAPLRLQVFDVIKNSYESRGMFSTEMIPTPMAKPWRHFPHKN
jgi:hypothetical protein